MEHTLFILDQDAEIIVAYALDSISTPTLPLYVEYAMALGQEQPIALVVTDQVMGEDGKWTEATLSETVYDSTNAENLGADDAEVVVARIINLLGRID